MYCTIQVVYCTLHYRWCHLLYIKVVYQHCCQCTVLYITCDSPYKSGNISYRCTLLYSTCHILWSTGEVLCSTVQVMYCIIQYRWWTVLCGKCIGQHNWSAVPYIVCNIMNNVALYLFVQWIWSNGTSVLYSAGEIYYTLQVYYTMFCICTVLWSAGVL